MGDQHAAGVTGLAFETQAITGEHTPPHPGVLNSVAPVIVPSSTFLLETTEHGAAITAHGPATSACDKGFIYSRWGGPTQLQAASVIKVLEQADAGTLVFSSGMAAISTALMTHLKSGDHVVCSSRAYGGTYQLLTTILMPRMGVEVTFVDLCGRAARGKLEESVRENTTLVYVESPTNPHVRVIDLEMVGEVVQRRRREGQAGLRCFCDATFASPYHLRALRIPGIDVALHSATKYMGGHSDLTAGVLSANDEEFLKEAATTQAMFGSTLDAFSAFLLLRGLKTLPVRMQRHTLTATTLSSWLEGVAGVAVVYYPLLPSHPDYEVAQRLLRNGGGGMVAFEVKGGLEAGAMLINSVQLIRRAVSLGGVETLIEHPASMTHAMVDDDSCAIGPGFIRLSTGMEDAEDLRRDLEQAFEKVRAAGLLTD